MAQSERPTIICITPVRNEAWILERFLQCTSLWADHIVIVDHRSTDGSRAMARAHPKVTLVEYDQEAFDEPERRRLLIETARELPAEGRRLIVSIDADEMLSANYFRSPEWQTVLAAEPGTVVFAQWTNILPDLERAWIPPEYEADIGFMDDGSDFQTRMIHGDRLPRAQGGARLHLRDIKLLHYKFADMERAQSRLRWYQCWETIHNPEHSALGMYRLYHRSTITPPEQVHPLQPAWLAHYEAQGIDMTSIQQEDTYYWDGLVLDLFEAYGTEPFEKLDIWNTDWRRIAERAGRPLANGALQDPRDPTTRAVHRWLKRTQLRQDELPVRLGQRLLRKAGW